MGVMNLSLRTNANATVDLIDNDGEVLLEAATLEEVEEYLDEMIEELEDFKQEIMI